MADIITALTGSTSQDTAYDELYREYLDHRVLFLNSEIDENVIEDYIMWILKWNREDIGLPHDCRKPIKIFISSPGGNVFDANIFVNVIEASKTPVWGIAMDLVASASLTIYLACHYRVAFTDSAFLLHDGEIAIENSRKKSKDVMDFFNQGDERMKQHVLSHTNIDSDFYDSIYSDEYWFYADRGKELGVVHKIIGEDVDLDSVLN